MFLAENCSPHIWHQTSVGFSIKGGVPNANEGDEDISTRVSKRNNRIMLIHSTELFLKREMKFPPLCYK